MDKYIIVPGRGKVKVNNSNGFWESSEKNPYKSPYERTKAQVYATGNKWAIENFHATHN